jgi:multimeric flavodoxin WrbA
MSKNILVIAGSPRVKSCSNVLADAFIKGATAAGHNVKKISLCDKNIRGCIGCKQCFKDGTPCVIKDDMYQIYNAFVNTHLIVLATPLHYFSVSALVKCMVDRMYCFGYPTGWIYPKRDCAMLVAGEDTNSSSYVPLVTYYNLLVERHLKWNSHGIVIAEGVQEPADVLVSPAFKEAELLGKSYK